ncbi:MAG: hypothetical protein ACYCOU_15645, partial [Sulfobacillus sp.]
MTFQAFYDAWVQHGNKLLSRAQSFPLHSTASHARWEKIFVCPSLMLLSQPVPLKLLLALTDLRSELPLLGANAQKMLGGASISPTR